MENQSSFAGGFSNFACAGFLRGLASVMRTATTTTEYTRRLQKIAAVYQHQCVRCSGVIIYVKQDRGKLKPIFVCRTPTYHFHESGGQPTRVHLRYIYRLPHLTAQPPLLPQNLDDGDDHGL